MERRGRIADPAHERCLWRAGLPTSRGRSGDRPSKGRISDPAYSHYRTTRALPPCMSFSTSFCVAIEVSPGVVEANAPCAAP